MKNGNAHHEKIVRRKRFFKSFEAKARAQRTSSEKLSDFITETFGSISFLILNLYLFFLWILLNSNILPNVRPFDPYPFFLLTALVSVEAITISIFVLLSQNRQTEIQSLRDELHLQVGLLTEEEITKTLEVLAEIREKVGIKKEDPELTGMLERIDTSYIERTLQHQIESGSVDIRSILKDKQDETKETTSNKENTS